MQVVFAKSVADLERALCGAEAIHSVIKDDGESKGLESINKVIKDLNHVKDSATNLNANDKLPE